MGQKMTNIAKPIIKQIKDNREALDFFEKVSLPAEDEKTQERRTGRRHGLQSESAGQAWAGCG